jgi:hypothetical protein
VINQSRQICLASERGLIIADVRLIMLSRKAQRSFHVDPAGHTRTTIFVETANMSDLVEHMRRHSAAHDSEDPVAMNDSFKSDETASGFTPFCAH